MFNYHVGTSLGDIPYIRVDKSSLFFRILGSKVGVDLSARNSVQDLKITSSDCIVTFIVMFWDSVFIFHLISNLIIKILSFFDNLISFF